MLAQMIVPGFYIVPLGFVNVFLLDTGSGLVLFDAGVSGSAKRILQAVSELGHAPSDLRAVLITHLHQDHVGGLGEIKRATGATVYMHALDAQAYQNQQIMRTIQPGPGLLSGLIVRAISRSSPAINPDTVPVDVELQGGEVLAEAGGVRAIHTPGHTAGHLVYHLPQYGGILIGGDIASNMFTLSYSILYEDLNQARRALAELPALGFEIACFSHGGTIRRKAAQQFAQKFQNA